MNPLPDLHLDINAKIAFAFIEPYMLAHHKMEKIYKTNYKMLMSEYQQYRIENGMYFCKDFVPYVYHHGINKLKLSNIERLQFEIFMREQEYNMFSFDGGHLYYFTSLLYDLVTEFIDSKIIDMERVEILRDSNKCVICENSKYRCKCHQDNDGWE